MDGLVLTESELKSKMTQIYKEEYFSILEEKWSKLDKSEKTFVVEFLKAVYPEKAKLINESKWYNTLGDIVGIFDPTGVVDLVNGISYWKQGDKLFAVLSWISVLPLIGDAVAKPVVGALKLGGNAAKAFRYAAAGKDAVKIAQTAEKSGGAIAKMVEKAPSWGTKLMNLLRSSVGKIPFLRRIIKLIEEYVAVFKTASVEMKAGSKTLGTIEKEGLKDVFRGFREYGGVRNNYFKYIVSKDVPLWNKFMAGSPRLFGGNPATRSLMRRSKWYLGLLDTLGIADTKTTPDELVSKYPNIEDKIKQYNNTEKAQLNWSKDFGSEGVPTPQTKPEEEVSSFVDGMKKQMDPIDLLFKGIFAK